MSLKKFYCAFLIFFFTVQSAVSEQIIKSTPLIIDTDMAMDDMIAISYILRDNNFDIKAIILDNNASTDCQYSYPHLTSIIALSKHAPIAIACGTKQTLGAGHRFPAWLQHKFNFMPGVDFPMSSSTPVEYGGISLIIKTLENTDQPVTVLELGSLTNLAMTLQKEPRLKSKIAKIYMMGGAINVPGNIHQVNPKSSNTSAEWNIYFDPLAANFIFKSQLPIYLIPLDATNQAPITMDFYNTLANSKRSKLGELNYQLLKINLLYVQKNLMFFWDPLAAVSADNPICQFQSMKLKVILNPENKVGAIKVTPKGSQIYVCTTPNTKHFIQILQNAIQ